MFMVNWVGDIIVHVSTIPDPQVRTEKYQDAQERRGRTEMAGQQDEVEGAAEAALVLSDVRETVQGRERLQVSCLV